MNQTALHAQHVALGARMVDFAGWHMPIQYPAGQLEEHRSVRTAAGLFDVSHMGQLRFRGPDALAVVNRLITNDLAAVPVGKAQYTAFCRDDGGILDDAICYRLADDDVLVVVNASNTARMVAWTAERAVGSAKPVDESAHWALLALQGPKAPALLDAFLPGSAAAAPFTVRRYDAHPTYGELIVASTGYTGERGFELFLRPNDAPAWFQRLLDSGADPIGLAARDTLRLEMGYALYGNDLELTTHPLEAGLGWVTRLAKPEGFIGRDALVAHKAAGLRRRLVGLEIVGRGIARHGYPVLSAEGAPIGEVTSGTQSPTLGRAIAMAYVALPFDAEGTTVQVDVRGRPVEARVTKPPFYRPG